MKTLRVGIAGYEQMKARALAIARGEYKLGAGEPKVSFTFRRELREGAIGGQSCVTWDHRRIRP